MEIILRGHNTLLSRFQFTTRATWDVTKSNRGLINVISVFREEESLSLRETRFDNFLANFYSILLHRKRIRKKFQLLTRFLAWSITLETLILSLPSRSASCACISRAFSHYSCTTNIPPLISSLSRVHCHVRSRSFVEIFGSCRHQAERVAHHTREGWPTRMIKPSMLHFESLLFHVVE